MQEFKEKVAVVTGGASGIGRAMADRFAAAGMKVVLADIDPSPPHYSSLPQPGSPPHGTRMLLICTRQFEA